MTCRRLRGGVEEGLAGLKIARAADDGSLWLAIAADLDRDTLVLARHVARHLPWWKRWLWQARHRRTLHQQIHRPIGAVPQRADAQQPTGVQL
ncbi:hypothetical protein BIV57_11215 [Mangrovactinospora gilvigrisea]|uniref:Uncharacterized protein n=1 Tax=Mangrovactinospora gilvigrisea TaxID=1428644 RepID=A0A1J7BFC1_9ACTN|nr:hypothetical protein [Mangrovactinospora gilvigrisea]OIV37379.1 hypothetical protein BIV57_11215 [Mangrovactinospora gilvigrisea]